MQVSPGWLALRERADAAARRDDLAGHLRRPASGAWLIHDLACGTGAMGRWLAPRLPGPQHWVLHDRDPDLLRIAAAEVPGSAADGAAVTVETRESDITLLAPGALGDASLVTATALLDILTGDELDGLVGLVHTSGCQSLFALSVTGHVTLTPADPLDQTIAEAFNDHQRRSTGRGRLLGPDAPDAVAHAFRRRGWDVLVLPSPWRLGPGDGALIAEWLAGWVGAAREQRPHLDPEARDHERRRLAQAHAGALTVTVGHADVLAMPPANGAAA